MLGEGSMPSRASTFPQGKAYGGSTRHGLAAATTEPAMQQGAAAEEKTDS